MEDSDGDFHRIFSPYFFILKFFHFLQIRRFSDFYLFHLVRFFYKKWKDHYKIHYLSIWFMHLRRWTQLQGRYIYPGWKFLKFELRTGTSAATDSVRKLNFMISDRFFNCDW